MTKEQKRAILLLNRLQTSKSISEEEYFELMEFVIGNNTTTTISTPWWGDKGDKPYTPWTDKPYVTYTGTNGIEKGEYPQCEMKTPEEDLGISSEQYNKIIDDCIFGEV